MAFRSGRWCLAVVLLCASSLGQAQSATTNPEDEYKKLVKVQTDIQPLGENPFGEAVNLFDGGLSFHVVDISVPGTGPTIEVGRSFHADGDASVRWSSAEFGDWDLDLPRLTTLTSAQNTIIQGPNQIGWLVNSIARTDRCTNFGTPPEQRVGRPGTDPIEPSAWWNQGYTLQIPGSADQDMLKRVATSPPAPTVDGTSYVAVSKEHWNLGCLSATANGEEGEAFLAVGPNGQKYWLNQLLYRPARDFGIIRNLGVMAATRMEDRFGNWLAYNWNGAQLTSIVASDGRQVTFEYAGDGVHVARINVVTASSGTRTWTYGYTAVADGQVLTSVTLPDGSAWNYDLSALTYDVKSTAPPGHCNDVAQPNDVSQVGVVVAPSGLQGRFEMHPTRHARAGVPEACSANTPSGQGAEMRPRFTNNLALTSKTFSGAAVGPLGWTYSYPLATASWLATCETAGCDSTSVTLVVSPSFDTTRYTFSNRADATEGKLKEVAYFKGADTSGAAVRTEALSYADAGQGPWPVKYGGGFNVMANLERQEQEAPQSEKMVTQDDVNYVWQALEFDAYARPSLTTRWSSLHPDKQLRERHTFLDNAERSIIGLPVATTNIDDGKVISLNNYDANFMLASRDRFGQRVMSYSFNGQGQLASFTDPRQNTTMLDQYVLGVPHTITFPDRSAQHPNGTTETVNVDGFGQVVSVTDQAGGTTSYSYDPIGRIARVDYPSDDNQAWASELYTYNFSPDALGMGGSHWVRTKTQGNRSERTDFDAMLRPVLIGKSEAGSAALYVTARTEYDWKGQKLFESYPADGMQERSALSQGTTTAYDPIGRVVSVSQSSELTPSSGGVTTLTDYLVGGVQRITDANGNQSITSFQSFDEPDFAHPESISTSDAFGAPVVSQTMVRDIYGNPVEVTQGGLTRKIVYNEQNRVCRTTDPETGSEITAYDEAGNPVWTASGQARDVSGCGYDSVMESDKTTRSFDAMNRITTQLYPAGQLALTFDYDPLGNVSHAVSDTSTGTADNRGQVSWTFGRNHRGLLTTEVLAVDAYSWTINYGYDANAAPSFIQFPDGEVVDSSPNALGQPTSAGRYLSGVTYFPNGQVKQYSLANGAIYKARLNDRQLLGAFSYGTDAGSTLEESLTYDRNANVEAIENVTDLHRSRTMTYDGLNRLSSSSSDLWGTESYTYDERNNLASIVNGASVNTYRYDDRNRLDSIVGTSPHSFAYDERGNVVNRDGQAFAFDLANRLLAFSTTGHFMYDASGRRVKSVTTDDTTYYAYNSAGTLVWEYNPRSGEGTSYIHLGTKLVASRKSLLAPAASPVLSAPETTRENVAYTVSWTSILTATSYDLQERVSGLDWQTIATTSSQSQAVSHSSAGDFDYQVRACNAGGCGAWSSAVTTTVIPPPTAPAAPANLSASSSGNQQSITITWSASPAASSYTLQEMVTGGTWISVYTGSSTNATVSSAADGVYSFQVQACNAAGCSSWQQGTSLTLRHVPNAPSALSVQGVSTGPIAVSWSTSNYALTYALQRSSDGANYSDVYYGSATSTSSVAAASGTYWFRVRACNSTDGTLCGPYSPTGTSSVTIAPTQPPGISSPASSNNGCYTVNWNGVPGATYYVMQEQVNGGVFNTVANDGSGALNVCGKGAGSYGYRVQGCNAGGCGPFSGTSTVTVSLVPPVPVGIHMDDTVVGRSERLTIYWNASPGATRYEIFNIKLNKIVYSGTGLSNQVEAGTVPYEMKYTYQLRACNDQGCSAWSGVIAG
ncbi:YD repeat-containing protein [Luteibacter sp. UNCMF331Sha3.1]|uniref:hypothetical protein n=1 Tax=Luteibacter sp. UNCMF331Sha3.1 TaxID=1502760 RepID=UPI0008BCEBD8|nr:hypothetical protein [Luteibacter sp. UNCMF331Sha3.1]SEM54414.1 YD repeat-containing protein [Luteibacter sp. UNCMF331Sha3.1]